MDYHFVLDDLLGPELIDLPVLMLLPVPFLLRGNGGIPEMISFP